MMVTLGDLWLPIVLSAVLVFLASSVIWMVLPWHRSDFKGLPDEDAVAAALRHQSAQPGLYVIPYAPGQAAMKNPVYVEKMQRGPVGALTLTQPGTYSLGKNLAIWFAYLLVVSFFVAYLTSRTRPAGAPYLEIFRVAGTAAVLAYAAGTIPNSIWFWKPWKATGKDVVDGTVYGLLTAGVFGWLWPGRG